MRGGKRASALDVESEVVRRVCRQVAAGKVEEARRRCQSASVDAVLRVGVVVAQVDETASELDQGFVVEMVGVGRCEPQVLEDVVGFVVVAAVEAGEVACVAWVPCRAASGRECGHVLLDSVRFFHGPPEAG